MKKKVLIMISAIVLISLIAVLITFDTPERHFKGEIVQIEKDENHLVFTVREDEKTEHIVHMRHIKHFDYIDSDEGGYAHNLRVGDYMEGTYYNGFPYEKEFAKEVQVMRKQK